MDLEKLQQLANTPAQTTSYSEGLAQAAIARANSHVGRLRFLVRTAGSVLLVSAVAAFAVLSGGSKGESPTPNLVVSAESTVAPTATESLKIAAEDSPSKTAQVTESWIPNNPVSPNPGLSTPTPHKTTVAPGLPADAGSYDEADDDLPESSSSSMASDPTVPAVPAPTPTPVTPPAGLPTVRPVVPPVVAPSTVPTPATPNAGSSPSIPRDELPNPDVSGEVLPPESSFPIDPTFIGGEASELIDRCTADDIEAEYLLPEVDAEGQATNAVRLQNVSGKPCWLVGIMNAKLTWDDTSMPLGSPAEVDHTVESGESLLIKVSYAAPLECLQATGTVTATISGLGDYAWPNSYLNECPAVRQ